jgi:hypothetical protein
MKELGEGTHDRGGMRWTFGWVVTLQQQSDLGDDFEF